MSVTVKGRGRIQDDDLAEGLAIALRDDYGQITLNVKEINTSVMNRLDGYDESQRETSDGAEGMASTARPTNQPEKAKSSH